MQLKEKIKQNAQNTQKIDSLKIRKLECIAVGKHKQIKEKCISIQFSYKI